MDERYMRLKGLLMPQNICRGSASKTHASDKGIWYLYLSSNHRNEDDVIVGEHVDCS
jgi:hypothetical protein